MQLSLYTYPADLLDGGIGKSLAWIREKAGFDAISYSAIYHTGKFLLPHNPRRRVHFNEGAAVYYRPDPKRYGRLRPRVSALVSESIDPLEQTCAEAARVGLQVNGWIVCLHNTVLATANPDCAITNAFGDPLIHSLCPGHPDSREYLLASAADLASRYPLARLELESPDYMGFRHGYHHEIIGVRITEYLNFLLGLCFCSGCTATGKGAGIDVAGLQAWVRAEIDALMEEDLPVPAQDPTGEDIAEALVCREDLRVYVALRIATVKSLVAQIKADVSAARPGMTVAAFGDAHGSWQGGGLLQDMAQVADQVITRYPVVPADATYMVGKLRQKAPGVRLIGSVRAISPQTRSSDDVIALLRAYRDLKVEGLNIYNYGLAKVPTLERIGAFQASR